MMNNMIEGAPLPEPISQPEPIPQPAPLPEPEPQGQITPQPAGDADSPSIPTDIQMENAPTPATDGFIEGEFNDIIPVQPTAPAAPNPAAPQKRKLSPALLALLTVLLLFTMCCLMAIVIFFMVYPAARAQGAALAIPLPYFLHG